MTYEITYSGSHEGTLRNLGLDKTYTSRGWLLSSVACVVGINAADAVWVRGEECDTEDLGVSVDWYLYACQDDADNDGDGTSAVFVVTAR